VLISLARRGVEATLDNDTSVFGERLRFRAIVGLLMAYDRRHEEVLLVDENCWSSSLPPTNAFLGEQEDIKNRMARLPRRWREIRLIVMLAAIIVTSSTGFQAQGARRCFDARRKMRLGTNTVVEVSVRLWPESKSMQTTFLVTLIVPV
jgi:hypothetical protein